MSSEIPIIPPEDPADLPRPTFWARLFCWLTDVVVLAIVVVLVHMFVFGTEIPDVDVPETGEATRESNVEFVVNTAIFFLYFAVMHGRFGKTIGKMIGRFHVANMDGTRIGYWTAFARAFWSTGILAVIEIPRMLYPDAGLELFSDAGAIYILLNVLCLVWDQKYNRALHDRLAGTRVILDAIPAPGGTDHGGNASRL